jgi:hypothetical protein
MSRGEAAARLERNHFSRLELEARKRFRPVVQAICPAKQPVQWGKQSSGTAAAMASKDIGNVSAGDVDGEAREKGVADVDAWGGGAEALRMSRG